MSPQIIEHVVLFRVKNDAEPSQVAAMVNGLNSLISLDQVLHLTAGPLLRTQSSSLTFTHILHCRYNSRDDLNAYTVHPAHVSLVNQTVIIDDVMAVDWIAEDFAGAVAPTPGSVLRVTFLKLKECLGQNEKAGVLDVIREMGDKFGSIGQFTFGQNFSPNRAKGFSIAILMVFRGLDLNSELVNLQKEKIRDLVEDEMVLDYIIGTPQSDSGFVNK